MSSLHKPFSHIYIEEDVREVERTQQILERFPKAILVPIDHYKEVFNRNNQNFRFQKNSPQLILAKRRGEFFYPGSTIAPDFGASRFYYNTVVLNCLYDCEYCYLQGMFPSAHLVAFVNNEDFIEAIRAELRGKQSIYLCLSYDTDLLAVEDLFGFCGEWIAFTREQTNLTIELRTKSVNVSPLLQFEPCERVKLAWTVTPDPLAKQFEQGAPSVTARLKAMRRVAEAGWPVRICLDPVIPIGDWQEQYSILLAQIAEQIPTERISEISIGTFRMGRSYFKNLKKVRPLSRLVHESYEEHQEIYRYSDTRESEILSDVAEIARKHFPSDKVRPHAMSSLSSAPLSSPAINH